MHIDVLCVTCDNAPRICSATPCIVVSCAVMCFAMEAIVGNVRIRLSMTGDNENNDCFSLFKKSAKEIHVNFSCFTGTVCIISSSSDDDGDDDDDDDDVYHVEDSCSKLPSQCLAERSESKGHNENVPSTRKKQFCESVDDESKASLLMPFSKTGRMQVDGSYRETFRESIQSVDSKRNLCVRLKDSMDQYEQLSFKESTPFSSTDASNPSKLHVACALAKISASELQFILDSNPQAASETDCEGRFPLHILSENEALLSRFVGRKDTLDFCRNLFETFPEAIIIRDNTGAFPFGHVIQNWVNDAYTFVDEINVQPRQGLVRNLQSGGKLTSDKEERIRKESSSRHGQFPRVVLTRQAQMSFEILSSFLDQLNESYRQGSFDWEANMLVRTVLAKNIADIPNLLKTVFLIDDADKRHWASCCSIVERVCFCSESTGDWVANMIQRGSVPSRRAVDYLIKVSGLSAADYVGPGRSPRADDIEAYQRDRNKVFETLENSAPLIPSLAVLSNDIRGHAATTDAVWLILNHCLSNPLVLGLLLADFVFSITLLQTFRYASNTENVYLFGRETSPMHSHEAITLFLSVCIYFVLRKLSEFYSLLRLSARAFRSYVRDFWNLIDVAAIALSLTTVLTQTDNPAFLALAMASLWMKLLGLLRAINAHLATFILAIQEIVRDIRWFLLVLAIAIFMFADTIHILTVHSYGGKYCEDIGEAPHEFCRSGIGQVYLKLWAVLVGDVNLEDFAYSGGIEFLFVVFTFFGIIVLLNILIAVVGDSYKKSVMNARYLFGRARVDFAVTFVAQEDLLKSSEMPQITSCRSLFDHEHISWFFGLFCRFVLVLLLVFTACYVMFIVIELASTQEGNTSETIFFSFLAIFFGVLLLVSVTLVVGGMFQGPLTRWAAKLHLSGVVTLLNVLRRTAELFAERTFGIGSPDSYKGATEMDPRLKLLQESVVQIVTSAKDALIQSMEAVEQRIQANASAIVDSLHASMEVLR